MKLAVSSLAECEAIIERGLGTFVEVGEALMRIRDDRLYLNEYATFDAYCQERWGWSRSHATHVISSADIGRMFVESGPGPANVRHARALEPLRDQPDVLRAVYGEIVEQTKMAGLPITTPVVREAVREVARRLNDPETPQDEKESIIRGIAVPGNDGQVGIPAVIVAAVIKDAKDQASSPAIFSFIAAGLRLVRTLRADPDPLAGLDRAAIVSIAQGLDTADEAIEMLRDLVDKS